eukprot:12725509-Alexandrium_andersonii.AAC.1
MGTGRAHRGVVCFTHSTMRALCEDLSTPGTGHALPTLLRGAIAACTPRRALLPLFGECASAAQSR